MVRGNGAGPEIAKTGEVPDVQWVGNENGQSSRTASSIDGHNYGATNVWCPNEADVSDRNARFWHPGDIVKSQTVRCSRA